jgi:hypothetical protein
MEISKAKIETFMDNIVRLEARIAELERANPLVGALPRGTSIVVLDTAGNLVAEIGSVNSGTEEGFALYADSEAVLKAVDGKGMLKPHLGVPMRETTGLVSVANFGASYILTHDGLLDEVQHKYISMQISMNCPAGTTGIVRLRTSSGQTSATKTCPPSSGVTATLFMELTAALGTPSLALWCEVNNNGGAGSVTISTPHVIVGDYSAFATTGGVWI